MPEDPNNPPDYQNHRVALAFAARQRLHVAPATAEWALKQIRTLEADNAALRQRLDKETNERDLANDRTKLVEEHNVQLSSTISQVVRTLTDVITPNGKGVLALAEDAAAAIKVLREEIVTQAARNRDLQAEKQKAVSWPVGIKADKLVAVQDGAKRVKWSDADISKALDLLMAAIVTSDIDTVKRYQDAMLKEVREMNGARQ